jgi:hypothetical protein
VEVQHSTDLLCIAVQEYPWLVIVVAIVIAIVVVIVVAIVVVIAVIIDSFKDASLFSQQRNP